MGFPLTPRSMTLGDLGHPRSNFIGFLRDFASLGVNNGYKRMKIDQ